MDYRSERWRAVAARHGIDSMPLYVTEWNASSGVSGSTHGYHSGEKSLAWVGSALVQFLKEGIRGATIYMHYPKPIDGNTFGTYEWDEDNNEAMPHRNMRAFELLSKTLKLGDGLSRITRATSDGITNAAGAVNVEGEHIAVLTNLGGESKTVTTALRNLAISGSALVSVYRASKDDDPGVPVVSHVVGITDGRLDLTLEVPAYSVVGVVAVSSTANGSRHGLPNATPPIVEIVGRPCGCEVRAWQDNAISRVLIVNSSGRIIRSITAGDGGHGWQASSVVWDGRDAGGRPVANSLAVAVVETRMGTSIVRLPMGDGR